MSQAIFLQWALTVRCFLEFWRYFYEWMDPSKRQRERNRGQRTWQLASLIQLLGGFYLWRTGTASGSHCSRVLWRTAPPTPHTFSFIRGSRADVYTQWCWVTVWALRSWCSGEQSHLEQSRKNGLLWQQRYASAIFDTNKGKHMIFTPLFFQNSRKRLYQILAFRSECWRLLPLSSFQSWDR